MEVDLRTMLQLLYVKLLKLCDVYIHKTLVMILFLLLNFVNAQEITYGKISCGCVQLHNG